MNSIRKFHPTGELNSSCEILSQFLDDKGMITLVCITCKVQHIISSMASKPINFRWIRTCSQPY